MKVEQLQDYLNNSNLDAAIFFPKKENSNITYFTGFKATSALIIPRSSNPFLVAPKLEFEKASDYALTFEWEKNELFKSILSACANQNVNLSSIGVVNSDIDIDLKSKLDKIGWKISDITGFVQDLRMIKTETEIETLAKSAKFNDNLFKSLFNNWGEFKTEADVAAFLVSNTFKKGFRPSFEPVVASGINASNPHHVSNVNNLANGFCVIDYGICFDNYCSDMTRTIFIGAPSANQEKVYNRLLAVQEQAINDCQLKTSLKQVEDNARSNLENLNEFFIHSLGHGLGVDVHEAPRFQNPFIVSNNMVFTIEPGLYKPKKFGIRIEDDLLIKNKPVVLSKTSKELQLF